MALAFGFLSFGILIAEDVSWGDTHHVLVLASLLVPIKLLMGIAGGYILLASCNPNRLLNAPT